MGKDGVLCFTMADILSSVCDLLQVVWGFEWGKVKGKLYGGNYQVFPLLVQGYAGSTVKGCCTLLVCLGLNVISCFHDGVLYMLQAF